MLANNFDLFAPTLPNTKNKYMAFQKKARKNEKTGNKNRLYISRISLIRISLHIRVLVGHKARKLPLPVTIKTIAHTKSEIYSSVYLSVRPRVRLFGCL